MRTHSPAHSLALARTQTHSLTLSHTRIRVYSSPTRQVIVIGLYRAPTAANGASLPYVYTAPQGSVILHPEDMAFALASIDQLPELHAGWDPEAEQEGGAEDEAETEGASASGEGEAATRA